MLRGVGSYLLGNERKQLETGAKAQAFNLHGRRGVSQKFGLPSPNATDQIWSNTSNEGNLGRLRLQGQALWLVHNIYMSLKGVVGKENETKVRVLPWSGCDVAPHRYRHASVIFGVMFWRLASSIKHRCVHQTPWRIAFASRIQHPHSRNHRGSVSRLRSSKFVAAYTSCFSAFQWFVHSFTPLCLFVLIDLNKNCKKECRLKQERGLTGFDSAAKIGINSSVILLLRSISLFCVHCSFFFFFFFCFSTVCVLVVRDLDQNLWVAMRLRVKIWFGCMILLQKILIQSL